ncbi:protein kinase domain-containing protein [Tundrisphaera lichenicola]|uniref:protein kinase domain-containing protein n=1 Tax=Tundrisphaera lichenicola TaxID=2029860 RepID=UPI003EBAD31E
METELRSGSEPVEGYRLIERLGRGGFGEVWKATGPGGFQVALKFVSLVDSVGPVEIRALDIIKDIRHPHLLATFGSWEVDGRLVIAMELADRTLLDRFREAVGQGFPGIPAPEIFEHFLDASKALDFLNEPRHPSGASEALGIQHRDVKPQNLLLVGGSVKVADFGLARVLEHSETGHTGSLTPSYAAPEFFDRKTSSQSDQYSLAVSYCQLRGGRLPFHGNPAEVMAGHMLRDPDLSMVPELERPAVARALSKLPKDRWPSCRAFVKAVTEASLVGHDAPPTRAIAHAATTTPMNSTEESDSEVLLRSNAPTSQGSHVNREESTDHPGRNRLALKISISLVLIFIVSLGALWSSGAFTTRQGRNPPTTPIEERVASPVSETESKIPTPPDPVALRDRGIELVRSGKSAEAIEVFDEAIQLAPNDARSFAGRSFALALYREPRLTPIGRVVADAIEALRLDPALALAHAARSYAFSLGPRADFDQGISEADEAFRLDHRSAMTYLARAHNYLRRGRSNNSDSDFRKAIADCTSAIRIEPNLSPAYMIRGQARLANSEADEALSDYGQALRINHRNAGAHALAAGAYMAKNMPDRAIAACERALKIEPEAIGIYRVRSEAYEAKGDQQRAAADRGEAERLFNEFLRKEGRPRAKKR